MHTYMQVNTRTDVLQGVCQQSEACQKPQPWPDIFGKIREQMHCIQEAAAAYSDIDI